MPFRIKPSRLARRKKLIEEGVSAAAKWSKPVRDQYLSRSIRDLKMDEVTPEITDEFRWDMLTAKKAMTLMGKTAAMRRIG